VAGGEAMRIGVSDDGALPLPWLRAALAQAQRQSRSHALLLHASVPLGQLELALALAQGWLCESPQPPCGRCASCRHVRARTHPDLWIVVPDALRLRFEWLSEDDPLLKAGAKPSREIRVEQIRDAIDWSHRSAGSARGRALVLHPAEALNTAAANALLKTLEEPPGRLRVVLSGSDPERLLPTLRSRVQRHRLLPPAPAEALEWLSAQEVPDAALLLAVAGGSPLDASALVQEGFDASLLRQLPRRVALGDASSLIGKPIPRVVDLLLKIAHDAQAQAVGAAPRYFDTQTMPQRAELAALQRWRQELHRVARHDEHPWNAGLVIEALVTNGARCWSDDGKRHQARPAHSIHSAR
jgi:DNA polymerase III subunit delta'